MVKIRLKRMGKKKSPFYRLVVINSREKRNGKYVELVGTYNPISGDIKVDKEIALKWLKIGAQPSETVRNIFQKEKILTDFHNYKHEELKNKPSKPKSTVKKTVVKKQPIKSKPISKPTVKPATVKPKTTAKPAVKGSTVTPKAAAKPSK